MDASIQMKIVPSKGCVEDKVTNAIALTKRV
jgi:hypothetical protein